QKRVDKRNRRWLLWGVDFLGFMSWIAFIVAFGDRMPDGLGEMIAIIWMGVLVLHGVVVSMTQNRDQEIEGEVARLRREIYDEKPKRSLERLQLNDDGELIDEDTSADKVRRDSV
ncbi:MAG: hypothetical protein ABI835_13535, partial [Chloroflexota bacterium]